ncbi:unnamed protein product [Caenorhabditis auriculariae]|uniref:IgGFc-binding protein N-terminal domain-containing protein n=1 Tax=Caenorhabditis auriculariae TaxID=2777116 RepID=A0A8S1GZ44_9PELO|nr:unnamed protein product [Caenorhabditis auriculariae]
MIWWLLVAFCSLSHSELLSTTIGTRNAELRQRFIPPAESAVNSGTKFMFSFLNSHLASSLLPNDTEILTVSVTNPSASSANIVITSPWPGFHQMSFSVASGASQMVTINPPSIQTNYMDPEFESVVIENKTLTLISSQPVFVVTSNTHADLDHMDKYSVIPVCQLGQEYNIVGDESSMASRLKSSNIFTVIATIDNTVVSILDYRTSGPINYTINTGQQVTLATFWYTTNIVISASNPVAVISGAVCGYGYYNQYECSQETVMLYPTNNYGLHVPYYKFLPEDFGEVMVLMQENNTNVFVDGVQVVTGLSVFQYIILQFRTGGYITANNPIYGLAIGSTNANNQSGPFFAHIPAQKNFINSPVTFPVAQADNEKSLSNYARVVTLIGNIGFIQLDSYVPNGLVYTRMGRSEFYFIDIPVQPGVHTVSSLNGGFFSVTVYGFGTITSYAFTPELDLQTSGSC